MILDYLQKYHFGNNELSIKCKCYECLKCTKIKNFVPKDFDHSAHAVANSLCPKENSNILRIVGIRTRLR